MTAYFNFALSKSVSRSTTLMHLPKAICFSSEEYFWKPRVQPSLGHRNIWLLVSPSASFSWVSVVFEMTSFCLARAATSLTRGNLLKVAFYNPKRKFMLINRILMTITITTLALKVFFKKKSREITITVTYRDFRNLCFVFYLFNAFNFMKNNRKW